MPKVSLKKRYKQQKTGYIDNNFWPRHEAVRILKLGTREEIQTALDHVPDKWRDWVKFYINDWIKKCGGLSKVKEKI